MALSSPLFCDRCGAANRPQAVYCSACGQAIQSSTMSRTLTGTLSQQHMLKQRYVILAQAGRGGFGAVYKAADTQFGNRLVAIKEMSQSGLNPRELQEATAAFKREALMLAGLTHPNLPRIYEQFADAGRSYLVMDFIEGETLEAYLDKIGNKPLPVEKVLSISVQLCSVLDYLHTRQPPIIFRDLKPANVMLTTAEHVYLIDFGIARHFKPGQTRDTTALGSSGYAAPEQYGKAQTTARADIYALGATLHQLLTGSDPTDSPFHFSPISANGQPILADLNTLILQMLSVEIAKRPASAADVKQELQRIATQYMVGQTIPLQYGTMAFKAPPAPQTPKAAGSAKQKSTPQIRPQINLLYACLGHSSRITALGWSPNGKHIASASFDKTVRIWDAANGNNLFTYKEHFGRINALAWSVDSKLVATASEDGTVRVWDALNGRLIANYSGHIGSVNTIAWSPDGRRIASAGEDKTVHIWDITSSVGKLLYTYRDHSYHVHAIAWSPNGKRIASVGEDRAIYIWDPLRDQQRRTLFRSFQASGRESVQLHGHYGRINALAWSPDSNYLAAASSNYQALVWNPPINAPFIAYKVTNPGMRNAVTWSHDGQHLAYGGNDKTVQIWNAVSKRCTFTYRGHTGYVMAVAWSPDGTRIASGGVDRTVQIWQVV